MERNSKRLVVETCEYMYCYLTVIHRRHMLVYATNDMASQPYMR